MKECDCEAPNPYPAPHKAHTCVKCLGWINPAWTSNDKTMGAFLSSLARILDLDPEVAPSANNEAWQRFRAHCEGREFAGRKTFIHSFHARNNIWEAMEEAADGLNYLAFQSLVDLRAGKEGADRDLLLTAAYHFYLAYEAMVRIRSLRHGVS